MSPSGKISVEEFLDRTDAGAETRRRNSLYELRNDIDFETIDRHFETVLLNVDWENLFAEISDRNGIPFELVVPEPVRLLAVSADRQRLNKLVRHSLQRLVTRAAPSDLIEAPAGNVHLQHYMRDVALEATRIYLAAHRFDRSDQSSAMPNRIRLTVHAKRDAPHIPAIYTLGPRAGNQLSQHVVPLLTRNGSLEFASLLEHHETRDFNAIYVQKPGIELSSDECWTTEGLPIAIAETGIDIFARLKTIFKEDWQ